LANAAQRTFVFLLLPIYTAVLSPAEYGRLGLLITIQSGISVALAGGMEAGVFRHFFHLEGNPEAQRRFVASAWQSLMIGAPSVAAVVAGLLVLFVPTSTVFRPNEAALAVLVAATLVTATIVPMNVLRAEQRLKDYITLTLVAGGSTAVLTVLSVVLLRLGVTGWLAASLIASGLTLAAAIYIVPWTRADRFDRDGMRSTLSVAVPMIPHSLSHWSLVLLDRGILAILVAPAALGIYTLAANLALPALILILSLNQGFMPSYARAQAGSRAIGELRNSITAQVFLVLFIGCALALLAPLAVEIMAPSYSPAAELVPWLVLGYVFLGFYYVPMNAISLIVGRTTFIWVLTVSAAMVNLGLIYILVPSYGVLAAAIASAVGYLVLSVLITLYALKLAIQLSIDWPRVLMGVALFSIAYVIGAALGPNHGPLGFVWRSSILLLSVAIVGRMSGLRVSTVASRIREFLQPAT
jgi:O-antigen/teichoic acid export membrane protein